MDQKLFQIIDANLNRTREGLRVCEDISRFAVADKGIARSLKLTRHATTKALLFSKNPSLKRLLQARDTKGDVLKTLDFKKGRKIDISDIFMSNIERVKESLRVLEECFKIFDENTSRKYRRLRFNVYDAEKKAVGNLRHISGNR
ncbi:thiamine-phosphate pyrophosphorylase [Candidatus Omnitrophota bacterium]